MGDDMAEKTVNNNDPLVHLPSEIILRIIDNATLDSVAKLTQLTRAWHKFIDKVHQDAIYSSLTKTERPPQTRDFSFVDPQLDHNKYYNKYYNDIQSYNWKDLCRRQILLKKSWNHQRPITRESTIQVGNDPIWRFRPDFKRRIFLSTSQIGGFNVTDMDSGSLLWHLDVDTVRPFAHLEYEDGTAVFDREGDAVEVWKIDSTPSATRGIFKRVAVLNHDKQTRGYQLRDNTLCVVSSEGKGYVYDLSGEPRLLNEIDIEEGAVGHLDQDKHIVAYSVGKFGYHFYDKQSGAKLGVLDPNKVTNAYHIAHPHSQLDCRLGVGSIGRASDAYPPQYPSKDRTFPIQVQKDVNPDVHKIPGLPLWEDEFGAGMIDGDLFAGVSRAGRLFLCSNWRKALTNDSNFEQVTYNVECESDGSTFDLGGWLAIRDHKVMFEVQDRAYIIGLNDDNTLSTHEESPQRPSWMYATSSAAQLAVPVSFMGIYDDCVMSTYTVRSYLTPNPTESLLTSSQTLRCRQRLEAEHPGLPEARVRILPTKVIRVLSFAPDLDNPEVDETIERSKTETERTEAADPAAEIPPVANMRSDLIQLIAMLEGEPEFENDLGLDEWLEEDEWEDEDEDRSDEEASLDDGTWP
jgi:hypothetical protein